MSDTEIIKGKVKTVFTTSEPDKVLIQYEDRVTAGNGKKVDYPEGKGKVCMDISAFLFNITAAENTGPAKQPRPTSSTPAILFFFNKKLYFKIFSFFSNHF